MDVGINLLPREITDSWEQKRKQKQQLAMMGTVLVMVAAAYAILAVSTLKAIGEASRLQNERLSLESEAKIYEQCAKLQAQVTQADKLVSSAVGTPPDWQLVSAGIGLYIPQDVWLTDFTASTGDGRKAASASAAQSKSNGGGQAQSGGTAGTPTPVGELIIRGCTFDHIAVATWLEEMHKIPGLSDILCQFSSEEESEGRPMVQFEIKASLLPGSNYQPQAGKAGE